MKEKLDVFLSRYSLSTHSLVAVCTMLVTMYFEVPQVHDYVYSAFVHLPAGIKNFISVAIIAIGWYWRGKKVWTPIERAEKTPVVGSAPPGTSAGGDNAPVEVALTQEPESVPPAPPSPPLAPAPIVVPSPKPSTDGW